MSSAIRLRSACGLQLASSARQTIHKPTQNFHASTLASLRPRQSLAGGGAPVWSRSRNLSTSAACFDTLPQPTSSAPTSPPAQPASSSSQSPSSPLTSFLRPENRPQTSQTQVDDGWDWWTTPGTKNAPPKPSASERWANASKDLRKTMADARLVAGKYAGRSEVAGGAGGIQAAIGRLGRTLAMNNVRGELRLVERYEKPTDKRRRLKSERHRRRFADMIGQKVRIVRDIKARGG